MCQRAHGFQICGCTREQRLAAAGWEKRRPVRSPGRGASEPLPPSLPPGGSCLRGGAPRPSVCFPVGPTASHQSLTARKALLLTAVDGGMDEACSARLRPPRVVQLRAAEPGFRPGRLTPARGFTWVCLPFSTSLHGLPPPGRRPGRLLTVSLSFCICETGDNPTPQGDGQE